MEVGVDGWSAAGSEWGLKLLVYAPLSYCGLKLLVHAAFSDWGLKLPVYVATSVCGLQRVGP